MVTMFILAGFGSRVCLWQKLLIRQLVLESCSSGRASVFSALVIYTARRNRSLGPTNIVLIDILLYAPKTLQQPGIVPFLMRFFFLKKKVFRVTIPFKAKSNHHIK